MSILKRLHQYLQAPVFPQDGEKTRIAELINIILLVFIALTLFYLVISPFFYTEFYSSAVIFLLMLVMRHGLISIIRRGQVRPASWLLTATLWVVATVLMLLSGGMNGPHMVTYVTTVLVAGLLLGGRGGIAFALMSVLAALLISLLTQANMLPDTALSNQTPMTTWIVLAANLVIVAMFQYLAIAGLHRELHRANRLAQEASDADQYKSRLLARVSHELRSPLGAVLGMADMLHYGAVGALRPEQQDVMSRIVVNAQYLRRLVNDLLEQSRIEVGQLMVEEVGFSPADLVEQACKELFEPAKEKGVVLDVELSADLPPRLVGDAGHCEQILSNLVGNAIKFALHGTVKARIFLPDEDHWAMQVSDTGVGIPSDLQNKIYEPFWQLDQSAARKYGGVGLGLSIVKQLTELMQGHIALESQVGQGSTFTVILPLYRKEAIK